MATLKGLSVLRKCIYLFLKITLKALIIYFQYVLLLMLVHTSEEDPVALVSCSVNVFLERIITRA